MPRTFQMTLVFQWVLVVLPLLQNCFCFVMRVTVPWAGLACVIFWHFLIILTYFFMLSLSDNNQTDVIEAFNSSSLYLR